MFADIFDPIIEERHNGYKKTDVHKTDLDASKIQGKNMNYKFASVSVCVSILSVYPQ